VATLQGHSDFVKCLLVIGNCLYSGSSDAHIRQWSLESHECLATLKQHSRGVEALAVSNDGLFLYSGSSDRSILRWNLQSLQVEKSYLGHDTNVTCIHVSDDDELWSGNTGDACVWFASNGTLTFLIL
jgi:WD40 repeat protein